MDLVITNLRKDLVKDYRIKEEITLEGISRFSVQEKGFWGYKNCGTYQRLDYTHGYTRTDYFNYKHEAMTYIKKLIDDSIKKILSTHISTKYHAVRYEDLDYSDEVYLD